MEKTNKNGERNRWVALGCANSRLRPEPRHAFKFAKFHSEKGPSKNILQRKCLSRSRERSALSKQGMSLHMEWTTRTDPATCCGLSEEAMDSSYWLIFFFLLHSRTSDKALSVIEV